MFNEKAICLFFPQGALQDIETTQMFGWNGNSSTSNIADIINEISLYKSEVDCPYTRLMLHKKGQKIEGIRLGMTMTMSMDPLGKCCKVKDLTM